jgi:hypothetical protein
MNSVKTITHSKEDSDYNMPTSSGPNQTGEENLVFAYDVGDVKNSYRGEPTVNFISNPTEVMPRGEFGQYRDLAPVFDSNGLTPYSLSMDIKVNKPGAVLVYMQNGSSTKYGFVSTWVNATTEYQRFYFENITPGLSDTNAGAATLATYTGYGSGVNPTVKNIQLEAKSHATPFANGTRSATQGLLPLVGSSTIDLANVSFDSNAQIIFDGTNDNITAGASSNYLPLSAHSLEAWVKSPGLGSGMNTSGIFGITYGLIVQIGSNGSLTYYAYNTDSGSAVTLFALDSTGVNLFDNNWHHIVCTRDSSNVTIYIDGVLNVTAGNGGIWSGTNIWDSMNMLIGTNPNNVYYYFNGYIDIARIYNRALTASEIRQNYQQHKTRFNLS